MTKTDQIKRFLEHLENLCYNLTTSYRTSYLMLDSNIDILTNNNLARTYLETIRESGFTQTIEKATRIQNNSYSLIDNILTNSQNSKIVSGVILSDISDHFLTFMVTSSLAKCKQKPQLTKRNMSAENAEFFKNELRKISWEDVLADPEVDSAYSKFWNKFETLFDLSFPISRVSFNRNHNRVNDYMTAGLLVSRKNKLNLHKIAIADPSDGNLSRYKKYRNLYNKIVRASKKLYFDKNFKRFKKNPKRTWSLINEALGTSTNNDKIEIGRAHV